MSKYFFERLALGYAGTKQTSATKCNLLFCNHDRTFFKGEGESYCLEHQSLLRDYGGPARHDRPWTFNKKRCCDFCGFNPWEQSLVTKITDPLIQDRVAWGMLIVDHKTPQRDGGSDAPENCQTLCSICNQVKTTLAGDSMPKERYKDVNDFYAMVAKLKPHYDNLFG